jgi:hypothetical protein
MDKPISLSIEEYMERIGKGEMLVEQRLNGTTAEDLYNVISKPKHYMLFDEFQIQCRAKENKGIEVRDVIEKLVRKNQKSINLDNIQANPLFDSDYVQLMQYLMRFMDKNGVEDLKKARWYLDKMIEAY